MKIENLLLGLILLLYEYFLLKLSSENFNSKYKIFIFEMCCFFACVFLVKYLYD